MVAELAPTAAGGRILVAESHELTARAVGRTLESAGYRMHRITDGSDLEEPWTFDACVIAARLGKTSVGGVIRDLRQNGVTAPIIALVGWSEWGRRDELMGAGADAVLLKPCGRDEIIGCLRRLLEQHQPEVAGVGEVGSSRSRIAFPILVSLLIGLGISLTAWLLQ
jgi:DNA-binding response OmpR family regulator